MSDRIKTVIQNGEEYQIRGVKQGDLYKAAVFYKDKRLCENICLTIEGANDLHLYHGDKALEFLFRALESDIQAGIIRV